MRRRMTMDRRFIQKYLWIAMLLFTLLFVGLKLGNQINWEWYWVLGPFWIPIGLSFCVLYLPKIFMDFIKVLARR
jgi:hypothetical protein